MNVFFFFIVSLVTGGIVMIGYETGILESLSRSSWFANHCILYLHVMQRHTIFGLGIENSIIYCLFIIVANLYLSMPLDIIGYSLRHFFRGFQNMDPYECGDLLTLIVPHWGLHLWLLVKYLTTIKWITMKLCTGILVGKNLKRSVHPDFKLTRVYV